ncbi:alpha/beta fold hydrolase [uncultured Methanobrevibacter sp.]|uniref:alpha/beta fold hydrolase n=1 Tax=uncultured Methanobrevibacter sp. TaxID=253161 RepID=UPI00261A1706|nr:alpha/beta fold hydrolase [uncultured Methanobrevibacter sp.]
MDSFEFESGQVLENVAVEYAVSGIPKYDDGGNITNAVVYCPHIYSRNSILAQYHNLIKNQDFNKDDYFFIRIFPLGVPESCSPSSTGLRHNFPKYTFRDRVNFKRQFLAEKFNINHLFGLVGEGLGGFEIYTWACEYPDEMDFIIVLNSSFKTYAQRYILAKCMENIIESCEDFYLEGYSSSFSNVSVSIFRLLFLGYLPDKVVKKLSNDEIDALMEDYVEDGLFMDIHDFKSRNDCILEYNVEDKLPNIKAKSLILGIGGHVFFDPKDDMIPLESLIENSKVFVYDSSKENYYDDEILPEMGMEILSFLSDF